MTYIYDIVLNFQDKYYNFFEWKKNDYIKEYSLVPIYKISDNDILIFKNNIVTIGEENLKNIIKDNKNKNRIICIVSNELLSIGLLFNNKGKLIKRSSLIFEEDREVNKIAKKLPTTKFNYKINKIRKETNKLRIEIEKKNKIIKYINSINNIKILKYLYYEYYEKEENNLKKIKDSLIKEINKNWTYKQNKLYNTINTIIKNTSKTN